MTEAVREMLGWAFSHPECLAVTATGVALDNYPSQKVLVKTGFVETAWMKTGFPTGMKENNQPTGLLTFSHF